MLNNLWINGMNLAKRYKRHLSKGLQIFLKKDSIRLYISNLGVSNES